MTSPQTPPIFLKCSCNTDLTEPVLHEFVRYDFCLPRLAGINSYGLGRYSVLVRMFFRCTGKCKKEKMICMPLPEDARSASLTEEGKLKNPE